MKVDILPAEAVAVAQLICESPYVTMNDRDRDVMRYCSAMSQHVWIGLIDEKPICCWGLVPPSMMSDSAFLWLYCTPLQAEKQFVFVRQSQRMIKKMLEIYSHIYGTVKVDSESSIRWLRWLGASFSRPEPNGMMPFTIRRKDG